MTVIYSAPRSFLLSALGLALSLANPTVGRAADEPPAPTEAAAAAVEGAPPPPAPAPWTPNLTFKPTGFIALNTAYNTGTPNTLDAPVQALAGSVIDRPNTQGLPTDGAFVLTARQTRIGVKLGTALPDGLDLAGVVEVDFWGLHPLVGGGGINQPTLRLRLAHLKLVGKGWSLLAGQDWAILANPFPTSLGHMVIPAFSGGGNLWNRLPQIAFAFEHDSGFKGKVAVLRPHSADAGGPANPDSQLDRNGPLDAGNLKGAPLDPGPASQIPAVEARFEFTNKLFGVGAAGHFANERYLLTDIAGVPTGNSVDISAWAALVDAKLAIADFSLYAVAFMGANLNGLFASAGVIRRPVDGAAAGTLTVDSVKGVPTRGGWFLLTYDIVPKELQVNAGAGIEQLDAKVVTSGVKENAMILANIIYSLWGCFDVALEYSRNMTIYAGRPHRGENDNFNLALRYRI